MPSREFFVFSTFNEALEKCREIIRFACEHHAITSEQLLEICCEGDVIRCYSIGCKDIGWTAAMLYSTNEPEIINIPDGYSLIMPPAMNLTETNNINKEDKTMPNYNATTKTPVHLYNYEDSPEDVEFEKKRKELTDEAEKKILDIRKELAVALDKLDEERFEQEMQRRDAMQAKAWKRKYDALIAEGFTIEQAWEMTMKWFEAD